MLKSHTHQGEPARCQNFRHWSLCAAVCRTKRWYCKLFSFHYGEAGHSKSENQIMCHKLTPTHKISSFNEYQFLIRIMSEVENANINKFTYIFFSIMNIKQFTIFIVINIIFLLYFSQKRTFEKFRFKKQFRRFRMGNHMYSISMLLILASSSYTQSFNFTIYKIYLIK